MHPRMGHPANWTTTAYTPCGVCARFRGLYSQAPAAYDTRKADVLREEKRVLPFLRFPLARVGRPPRSRTGVCSCRTIQQRSRRGRCRDTGKEEMEKGVPSRKRVPPKSPDFKKNQAQIFFVAEIFARRDSISAACASPLSCSAATTASSMPPCTTRWWHITGYCWPCRYNRALAC